MNRRCSFLLLALSLALGSGMSSGCASDSPKSDQPGSGSAWLTDLPKAQAKAKADNKMVFMLFTGSDWCPACMIFDKQILQTSEFNDYAAKNLILVMVDFPNKTPQNDELKKSNDLLNKTYAVDAFPTTIILNHEGKEIDRQVGYAPVSPKAYINGLEKLKGKN
jgi:thioredoxin-related protein